MGDRPEARGRLHAVLAERDRPRRRRRELWVGVGALGVAIAGIVALGESASFLRLGFLALILAGIIGLKLVEG